MRPSLIHPVQCKILKHKSDITYDEDFREPTEESKTAGLWDTDNPVIIEAQVHYFTTPTQALMNGYQDNITGYLLGHIEYIRDIIERFDKIIQLNDEEVELYILLKPEPRTVYNGTFTLMRLPFGTEMKGTVR